MDKQAFREELLTRKKKQKPKIFVVTPPSEMGVLIDLSKLCLEQLKELVALHGAKNPTEPVDFVVTERDVTGKVKAFKVG